MKSPCSSRRGFSFLLPEQKKRNKENSPAALFGLLRQVFPLNKKNSLTLKQLFVFHAPTLTSASRPKSEAGPFCFFLCNIASLVGVWCFLSLLRSLGRYAFFFASLVLFVIQSGAKRSEGSRVHPNHERSDVPSREGFSGLSGGA